ncbi:MAG: site-specific DNA-methyltransferase [Bacteroidales bacterium]|jgi:DNA modification methylase|nr:site-specific DNA-methyltransferase [Bacteroidales bacterium]
MINENCIIESSYGKDISNAMDYHSLPRFRWYGYKEGFSPNLVEEAIQKVGIEKNDYILDPFNGNGTVTLTASINNIKSVGIEVNPFVAFMSQTKLENFSSKDFSDNMDEVLNSAYKSKPSLLCSFSTFSEKTGKDKWLFNSDVLNSFEGGWQALKKFPEAKKKIFQLSLIGAAMDNCNAVKDGKCLKYRNNWQNRGFDRDSFIFTLKERLKNNKEDLEKTFIPQNATIINNDARQAIKSVIPKYKLCITSPPYLNSFDYTDIYRPELFLGKFIHTAEELRQLRFNTIRSHVEVALPKPKQSNFGEIYHSIHQKIKDSENNWSKQIPIMIQSYFEDMQQVLFDLLIKAKNKGELWLIVANSVYVGTEIPVDLILAEIGTQVGWKLKRIEVLRYIYRRKTKYCGNINKVRESLIVFRRL